MPRPKGSKNKSNITEEPKEFDYERDDGMFDTSYKHVSTGVGPQTQNNWTLEETMVDDSANPVNIVRQNDNGISVVLFLVEGEVQMQPREPGRGSLVAKQFRLVYASSDQEAVNKFSNYFRSLSDASSVYTVLRAAAMETLS